MRIDISRQTIQSDFVKKVAEISGESVLSCNQCGKCSAGCPMAFAMDWLPNQIIRLVQLGVEEDIASAKTPWICASCLTCSVRCPRGVDLGRLMEAIRLLSLRKDISYVTAANIPPDALGAMPQLALVGSFRKHTA